MVKDSEPVRAVRIAAIGVPGQRTFYLQVESRSGDLVTRLLEKAQAIIIVDQIDTLLEQIERIYPAVPASADVLPMLDGDNLVLHDAGDPAPVLFRAGQFALQYEPERDLIRFQVRELREIGQGKPQSCLWWATLQQVRTFGEMTRQVIRSGITPGLAAQTE